MAHFTWIPLYEEIATKLAPYRDRQRELIGLLEDLRSKGLKGTPLSDRDESGRRFLMDEIDPFTFFGAFNRGITADKRIAILRELTGFFKCKSPLPSDFDGIPVLNNQRSWFIRYKADRGKADVATLWSVFGAALVDAPLADPDFSKAFDAALEQYGISFNLTMGLFWIRPGIFVNLDSTMRNYLHIEIPAGGLTFDFYKSTVEMLRRGRKESFPELSHAAYLQGQSPAPASAKVVDKANTEYWMVGAYWHDRDPADQTERLLAEGVWENGYKDRYLEEVRAMKPGDRIAIKAASTQRDNLPFDARGNTVSCMTIKATGTIVGNPGTGRSVDVEWDPQQPPRPWYFYTYRNTVWHLRRDMDLAQRLIKFAFQGAAQDYDQFVHEWYDSEKPPEVDDGAPPYNIGNAIAEGLFVTKEEFEDALRRLRSKRNLILQGAPGVGKTFFARRLAYALLEAKDDERIDFGDS